MNPRPLLRLLSVSHVARACLGTAGAVTLALATLATPALRATPIHTTYNRLFDGGPVNAHSYRIPSLIRAKINPTTNIGTLVAFAECRQTGNEDYETHGKIVCRRSFDNGATWQAEQTIAVRNLGSYANPTAVFDPSTGRIWLFFLHVVSWVTNPPYTWQHGDKLVNVCYSDTDGATWTAPDESLNATLSPASITQDYIGPGVGLQTTQSNSGRLIIPAYLRNFYSDDQGGSWHTAWVLPSTNSTYGWGTETAIVECLDGGLYRNDRAANAPFAASKSRVATYGVLDPNGVSTFQNYASQPNLPDPQSEGSLLRYNITSPDRIIFLNSASGTSRQYMMARISYNQGISWKYSRYLTLDHTGGFGGYSSLTKTSDFCIGALVEFNEDTANSSTSHRSLDFHKFNLEWIWSATDTSEHPGP